MAAFGNRVRMEADVDTAPDEIEIERVDAGLRQRVPDQRRFIGAIHARDVQT
jgi:hypothetical protein